MKGQPACKGNFLWPKCGPYKQAAVSEAASLSSGKQVQLQIYLEKEILWQETDELDEMDPSASHIAANESRTGRRRKGNA